MGVDLPPDAAALQPMAAYCAVSAARRYNLPLEGLVSIMLQEGGTRGTVSLNNNGSSDLGVMQINTVWLKPQSPLFGYVSEESLKHDTCANIHAAAWIWAANLLRSNGDVWRAVGRYHAPYNTSLAWAYTLRVHSKLETARQLIASHPAYVRYIGEFFGSPAVSVADNR